ncbi:transglutaminase family protein [Pseudonocardia petroleophila]|uniref:Transglutaminase family protein n=1 Tax=Pseudonocardia petroleophila TaxID=37331 RepID=A0A7G7MPC2_9PSEU|nr:transglutaminase family protein [Pseudonocardia petroleophila]QNG54633.1 transglutaminase family protein [Pseudonocardia petroleophila]
MRTYRVTHRTSYAYRGEVSTSFGRAHLLPADRPRQTCVDAAVTVTPRPAEQHEHTDAFGNRSTFFAVTAAHRALTVLAESTVAVAPAVAPVPVAWEDVRDGLLTTTTPDGIDARGYVLPSPRLGPDPAVTAYARPSFPPGRAIADAALDLSARIHRDFRYVSGSSTVRSSVADLFASGEGVCQDFAHLAVAGLRSMGLAARYVSGYLETRPPPGRPRVVGADASHAWVSVRTGDGWFDVDPTNDRAVDDSFVELAHGRDYADVPPLRGVIFSSGGAGSELTVAVDMIRLDGGYGRPQN